MEYIIENHKDATEAHEDSTMHRCESASNAPTIAERLRLLRSDLGLTQREAATKFTIPLGTWKQYEKGPSEPGSGALRGLATEGVNTNWLLTGEGEMYTSVLLPSLGDLYNLDKDRLRLSIKIIEEILLESGQETTPAKKAEAIALAYDIFEEEETGEADALTKRILAKFVKSLA